MASKNPDPKAKTTASVSLIQKIPTYWLLQAWVKSSEFEHVGGAGARPLPPMPPFDMIQICAVAAVERASAIAATTASRFMTSDQNCV